MSRLTDKRFAKPTASIPFDIALLRYDPLYILELEGKDKRKFSIAKEAVFLAASYMRDEEVIVRKTQHNYIIHFFNLTKDEIKSQLAKALII